MILATRDEQTGGWRIEPAELFRLFKRELEQEREERARERRQLEDSLKDLRGERDRFLELLQVQARAVRLLTDERKPKWRGLA